MTNSHALRLAVDIGGTFTDTVLVNAANDVLATAKTPTTPASPDEGALAGVRDALAIAGAEMGDVAGFIHGTTLATNALIERKGACVATITTGGFRDILEIGYERRYSQYDINIEKPDLIVPRSRSFTITERMTARGEVVEPLDETAISELAKQLDACGAQAVAICLLHAYANPAHEQRLRDLLLEQLPGLTVSISSDVSPEAREFERLCTTVANAYVQPAMSTYLRDFETVFNREGLSCPILMITSGGGMTTLETAARFPIRLVESGPAGGAILAAREAARARLANVLSFDMGGTTAKLCLIDDFQPQTTRQFEISRAARFIKGSGMPVRIPVIEMIEIGAGGGSIASVDGLGRLMVGPESAGSDPGPAGFDRGGTGATVSDADILMGLIDPARFAEGRLQINKEKSRDAMARQIAGPLDIAVPEAAFGVSEIVDENMASAGRMHAVESGKDLSDRVMIAFGGNGPLHATRVARRAGINRILVPRDPGVGSAIGFIHAPVSFEIVRSRYTTLEDFDREGVNALFASMIEEAEAVVRAGAPTGDLIEHRSAFMRYHGQGHEIEIELPTRPIEADDIQALVASFEGEYARQFSRAVPGMTIEVLNWAVTVSTRVADDPVCHGSSTLRSVAAPETREIVCDLNGDKVPAGVYQRADLHPGDCLAGPALIVEPQTTTLVSADFLAEVDGAGNLLLVRHSGEETVQ